MTVVRRFDRAASALSKAVRTDEGYLKAPARLTRTGVFEYLQQDGTKRRELRLPEEVFAEDSIQSFELLPVTIEHPQKGVDSKTARSLSVGSVGTPRVDGQYLTATVMVTDSNAISKIESGKQEISCGYFCELEKAPPGALYTDADGRQHGYDFIQRNIRGNHVAVVSRGRAGPEVRLQLDSGDAESVVVFDEKEVAKVATKKIKIDSAEVEVDAVVAEAIEAERAMAKAAVETATAKADSAEAARKDVEAKLAAATSAEHLAALVKARVELETKAAKFEVKADGLTDAEIKAAVVSKLNPTVKLDGKSPEYIQAAYDYLTENAAKGNVATQKAARMTADSTTPEVKTDLNSAIAKLIFR